MGPLLAAWFQVMDFYVPGRSAGLSRRKSSWTVVQGPLHDCDHVFVDRLAKGAGLLRALASIRGCLRDTWVKSVYVWSPVQAVQQLFVPQEYRKAVANGVRIFGTYLAMAMLRRPTRGYVLLPRSWLSSDVKW